MGDRILRTEQAAEYIGLRPQTLRLYRVRGSGPSFIRLGTGMRAPAGYRRSALDEWLAERTFTSTSQESEAMRRAGGS